MTQHAAGACATQFGRERILTLWLGNPIATVEEVPFRCGVMVYPGSTYSLYMDQTRLSKALTLNAMLTGE
jgi:hypothetical protein